MWKVDRAMDLLYVISRHNALGVPRRVTSHQIVKTKAVYIEWTIFKKKQQLLFEVVTLYQNPSSLGYDVQSRYLLFQFFQ